MSKLYIIPDALHIEESLALAERYGAYFEYNDFYIPEVYENETRVDALIELYKSLPRDRSLDTLHGAFLDVTVHSADSEIRAVSDKRIRQSMDIARRLGACAVIFHTNLIANFKTQSYIDGWISKNAAYWRALSSEYPDTKIYIENMFDSDPTPLKKLMESVSDVPNIRACFDFAHAAVFGNDVKEWADAILPYAEHVHINDNDGVADLHLEIGTGMLDYAPLCRALAESKASPSVLIEMRDASAQARSIEYMQKNHMYPFEKRAQE
jgi:sugar phosphate isomerase/epimerase